MMLCVGGCYMMLCVGGCYMTLCAGGCCILFVCRRVLHIVCV